MIFNGSQGEFLIETQNNQEVRDLLVSTKSAELSILWFHDDLSKIEIDGDTSHFNTHDIIFLTEFNKLSILELGKVSFIRFNKSFFCVLDHDSEVGCKGILFYGAGSRPQIQLEEHKSLKEFTAVWDVLRKELRSHDQHQLEMLQMLLKRILILCTRTFKKRNFTQILTAPQDQLIRDFNFLVERHFKEKQKVSDYAQMLFKSPKTLSNVFKNQQSKSPLSFIHDRILIEAKRMLAYTDLSASEIGYKLNFKDQQSFGRFFKSKTKLTPIQFRAQSK